MRHSSVTETDTGASRPPAPSIFRVRSTVETQFTSVVESAGMAAALLFLNARARYRFTGIYRADPPWLRNECLVDRENPSLALGGDVVRLDHTYCGIAVATASPFIVVDSGADPRIGTHPARDSVVSYIGVPLRTAEGRIFGTLCHFDLRPRILPLDELAVMESLASRVSHWLRRDGPGLS